LGTAFMISSVVVEMSFGVTKIRRYSACSEQMMAVKIEMLIPTPVIIKKMNLVP